MTPGSLPRVLIACPTYRLEPETVDAIFRQTYRGPMDVFFTRDNPEEHDKFDHLHNYKKIAAAAIAGGYDFLWTVESDIIPPVDALAKLIASIQESYSTSTSGGGGKADMMMGPYLFRRGKPVLNIARYEPKAGGPTPGMTLSSFPRDLANAWGHAIRCSGLGLGCNLIRTAVLREIPFRLDPDLAGHCDWHFTVDLLARKKLIMADMRVLCGHKNPAGEILWLEPGREDSLRLAPPAPGSQPSAWHYWRAYENLDPRN